MTATVRGRPRVHYAWIVLGVSSVILLMASGVRTSFGVFIQPLEAQFGWGRTSLSVVASLSLFLYGAVGPLVGRLADRWGPRGVMIGAVLLLGLGAIATSSINSLWQLYLTAGIITASRGQEALQDLLDLPLTRYPHDLFLWRIWELRDNLTAYDAAYVALAEALGAPLVTCDSRLASASGHHARIEVV